MPDPLRILIVDDDPGMAETLGDVLEAKGYRVDVASGGLQAVARLRAQAYDVIFLDIKMPDINGLEVLRQVKLLGRGTVAVMMTAHALPDVMAEAEQEGALAVLAKPLPVERVIQFLEELGPARPVLIVEDDSAFASSLRDVLEAHGLSVACAADAVAAVEAVQRFRPDVVLLDLKLPVSNGYEVQRELRQLDPNVTILLMTGYGQELKSLVDQSLRDGARVCLHKPFDPKDVLQYIAGVRVQRAACQLQG